MKPNCADIKARLIDLLYGELTPGDERPIREHLAQCRSCSAELASVQATSAALDALPAHDTQVDLARLCLRQAEQVSRVRRNWFYAYWGTCAAVLLIAASAGLLVRVEVHAGHMVVAWSAERDIDEEQLPSKLPDSRLKYQAQSPDVQFASAPGSTSSSEGRPTPTWGSEAAYLQARDELLSNGLGVERYENSSEPASNVPREEDSYRSLRSEYLPG